MDNKNEEGTCTNNLSLLSFRKSRDWVSIFKKDVKWKSINRQLLVESK